MDITLPFSSQAACPPVLLSPESTCPEEHQWLTNQAWHVMPVASQCTTMRMVGVYVRVYVLITAQQKVLLVTARHRVEGRTPWC